jgi:hypothetical protein
MKFSIRYWDCGDCLVTRTVEAADEDAAVELLVNDDQHPLGQVESIQILDEVKS